MAKILGLGGAMLVYIALLSILVNSIVLKATVMRSSVVKSWLGESGIYTAIVNEQANRSEIQQSQVEGAVQLTADDIASAMRDAYDPSGLQKDAENVIDGVYAWLDGSASSPQYNVDFSKRQMAFADQLTQNIAKKVDSLPACESDGTYSSKNFTLFSSTCLPAGVSAVPQLTNFEKGIIDQPQLFPEVVYSGSDLKVKDASGSSVSVATALSWLPKTYKVASYLPYVLGVLVLLIITVFVLFSSSKRYGLRRVAHGLTFVGALTTLAGLALGPLYSTVVGTPVNFLGLDEGYTSTIVNPILKLICSTYSRDFLVIGLSMITPALVIYGALIFTRKKITVVDAEPSELSANEIPMSNDELSVPDIGTKTDQPQAATELPAEETSFTQENLPNSISENQPTTESNFRVKAQPPQRPVTRRPPMIQG